MAVRLIWVTPEAEKNILYMARVSSENQESTNTSLLKYLIKNKHWSPFEMASMCVEINTTRAIAPQILRHRSFSFQEFSQRYAQTTSIEYSECRRQDLANRQNSIDDLSSEVSQWWANAQNTLFEQSQRLYVEALDKGIAKECARSILPLSSSTKMYMSGTLRSWIHYIQLRTDTSTQLEHREIALQIKDILIKECPTFEGFI